MDADAAGRDEGELRMEVKCRGFKGKVLSLKAECLGRDIFGKVAVQSYAVKFQQETGEIIEICGLNDGDFEIDDG